MVTPEEARWRHRASAAARLAGTPCFAFCEREVATAFDALTHRIAGSLPQRHWLSFKTQPVRALAESWLQWGHGVEVVSEFELAAVRQVGFPPERILVNGVGKGDWLHRYNLPGLVVHFDSIREVLRLRRKAAALGWRVGVRCAVPHQTTDQTKNGSLSEWDQFGMTGAEIATATARLGDVQVDVRGIHFHIGTSVASVDDYRRALEHVREDCAAARLAPEYLDIGGGLPIPGERPLSGISAASSFDFEQLRDLLRSIPALFPSVREVWLENGRFLTGAAGALVVTVLEKKERDGRLYLICDGGRTNHARLAAAEVHDIILEPHRAGPTRQSVLFGPTCGAVDRLGSWDLPDSVVPGDRIIWLNAGAYHIPLETRFSFGLAPVVWFNEEGEAEIVRERETPAEWWAQWTSPVRIVDAVSR